MIAYRHFNLPALAVTFFVGWIVTDEVTLIADKHASREAYDELKGQFSDAEIPWLILAVVQINSWNRIAISTRAQFERAPAIAVKTPEPV